MTHITCARGSATFEQRFGQSAPRVEHKWTMGASNEELRHRPPPPSYSQEAFRVSRRRLLLGRAWDVWLEIGSLVAIFQTNASNSERPGAFERWIGVSNTVSHLGASSAVSFVTFCCVLSFLLASCLKSFIARFEIWIGAQRRSRETIGRKLREERVVLQAFSWI